MDKIIENDKSVGTIVGTDGVPLLRPALQLQRDEAAMLRAFDKFLTKYGLQTTFICRTCFAGSVWDGMKGQITPSEIELVCHHRQLIWFGSSD